MYLSLWQERKVFHFKIIKLRELLRTLQISGRMFPSTTTIHHQLHNGSYNADPTPATLLKCFLSKRKVIK